MTTTCPPGSTLQSNGLCGTGPTYSMSGPTYCGPQYNGKNCSYMAQLTPGITEATRLESQPNTICAYRDGDTQIPCDPGCCGPPPDTKSAAVGSDSDSGTGGTCPCSTTGSGSSSKDTGFFGSGSNLPIPAWAIILLVLVGSFLFALLFAWLAKKMSRHNRGS